MSAEKIITIIVPSYNMEKYLPKCLGSLVVGPELMERLEVLVVNDGSKDRTSEIAHEFAAKWPQTFKVIDKPNGHYGSCINAALPVATGKYVKVLDADDYFDTAVLTEYLAFLGSFDARRLEDEVYSRRIRYRYIRAWRRHAPLLGLCIAGCKLYSKVAPRLYAWYNQCMNLRNMI